MNTAESDAAEAWMGRSQDHTRVLPSGQHARGQELWREIAMPSKRVRDEPRGRNERDAIMDAPAAVDWIGQQNRCGRLFDGAITGSYTRFAQRTACMRSGAMKQDRVHRIERTTIKPMNGQSNHLGQRRVQKMGLDWSNVNQDRHDNQPVRVGND